MTIPGESQVYTCVLTSNPGISLKRKRYYLFDDLFIEEKIFVI